MRYFIEENTLTDIADAVREKGGTTEPIAVKDLATAITNLPSGGGSIEVEPIVLTGDQDYGCSGAMAAHYINLFGDTVSTQDLENIRYMFQNSTLERIPFSLNAKGATYESMDSVFYGAEYLKEVPAMNNFYPSDVCNMFTKCYRLAYIPDDIADTWNWDRMHTYGYSSYGDMFKNCYALRKVPTSILKNAYGIQTSSSYLIYNAFDDLIALDELVDIPVVSVSLTSNVFSNTFMGLKRAKSITFEVNEDGSAKTAAWRGQTVDMQYCGVIMGTYLNSLQNYSGITADKKVKDDAAYQALKNDPDWFTDDYAYSRYNHTSAVETINSLPDCSATGTNTIKFKGIAGSATDGGAINTLTEEEIAVAAAKGWTVSLV